VKSGVGVVIAKYWHGTVRNMGMDDALTALTNRSKVRIHTDSGEQAGPAYGCSFMVCNILSPLSSRCCCDF